jgi:hypothetical protein
VKAFFSPSECEDKAQQTTAQVEPKHVGWQASPNELGFSANVTRFEEVSPMHTLSTLGAPLSSRSRD